jgi:geranylgeranyl reductase family protein
VDYDVIVVGAGPAGASAAYWLGEAGKRVLVLERERLPRYKPCGGGVPKAIFGRFPFDLSAVIEREVGRVCFRFRDGRQALADLPGQPVAMVMRDRFDLHILQQARADVRDGSLAVALRQDGAGVLVGTRSGETYRGRYVVGADGANSRVARLAGLRRGKQMGTGIEVEVPCDDHLLAEYADTALFVFGTHPFGYQWIFPKAGHLSVGIGVGLGKAPPTLRGILRREMAALGVDVDGARWRGHPLPVYLQHEPLRRGRVLLAGDAAGLVDPLLGEGIRHAVDSGRLAAQAVLTGDVAGYTRRIRREIGTDLLWGLRWARLFYGHPWGSFELGVRNPLFVRDFLRLFAGQITYRRMAAVAPFSVLLGLGRRLPAEYVPTRTTIRR